MADPADELAWREAEPEGGEEENEGVHRHPDRDACALRKIRRDGHFKGHRGCARDAEARADGKVDQNGEDQAEAGTDLLAKPVEAVEAGDHNDAEYRQNDCREQKAEQRRNSLRTGVLAEKRRKDQISRAKEQGKQHKADQKHVFLTQFHFFVLFF